MDASTEQSSEPAQAPPPTHSAGWYEDPPGSRIQRYYDGTSWTEHSIPPDPPTAAKRHPLVVWVGVAALLWIGAEAHDSNCYTRATLEAIADTSPDESSCLILPWNEPSD